MKLTVLGHVWVKSPDMVWARVDASNTERSGRCKPMPRGVLSSIRSNGDSVNSFYHHAIDSAYKWLNRRGGKKSSFTWATFKVALRKLGVALPRYDERKKQNAIFA
jgi:hypothetical protein